MSFYATDYEVPTEALAGRLLLVQELGMQGSFVQMLILAINRNELTANQHNLLIGVANQSVDAWEESALKEVPNGTIRDTPDGPELIR